MPMLATLYYILIVAVLLAILFGLGWHYGERRKNTAQEQVKQIDNFFRFFFLIAVPLLAIVAWIYHQQLLDF